MDPVELLDLGMMRERDRLANIRGLVNSHEVVCKADDAVRYSKNILSENLSAVQSLVSQDMREKFIQCLNLLGEIQSTVHILKCDTAGELKNMLDRKE